MSVAARAANAESMPATAQAAAAITADPAIAAALQALRQMRESPEEYAAYQARVRVLEARHAEMDALRSAGRREGLREVQAEARRETLADSLATRFGAAGRSAFALLPEALGDARLAEMCRRAWVAESPAEALDVPADFVEPSRFSAGWFTENGRTAWLPPALLDEVRAGIGPQSSPAERAAYESRLRDRRDREAYRLGARMEGLREALGEVLAARFGEAGREAFSELPFCIALETLLALLNEAKVAPSLAEALHGLR